MSEQLDPMGDVPPHQQIGQQTTSSGDWTPPDFSQKALTDSEVLACLNHHASKNCCRKKKGPFNDIKITNIIPSLAFKYTLETFTEQRQEKWNYKPADGPPAPNNDIQVPDEWAIPVSPPTTFKEHSTTLEEPNTSYVKICHGCYRRRDVRCTDCRGRGCVYDNDNQQECVTCSGFGGIRHEKCTCDGTGTKDCPSCHAPGKICTLCDGKRCVRSYIELTVTWKKHDDTLVIEKTTLPDKLVKSASGQVAFSDECPRVAPVFGFLDPQIGQASQNLIQKHGSSWPQERVLMQRHSVQIVPVNTVEYILDGKEGVFHIYGDENKVHFSDYPSQCCGCCTVM